MARRLQLAPCPGTTGCYTVRHNVYATARAEADVNGVGSEEVQPVSTEQPGLDQSAIDSMMSKLEIFRETLPADEQRALAGLVLAACGDIDVQPFAAMQPLSAQQLGPYATRWQAFSIGDLSRSGTWLMKK